MILTKHIPGSLQFFVMIQILYIISMTDKDAHQDISTGHHDRLNSALKNSPAEFTLMFVSINTCITNSEYSVLTGSCSDLYHTLMHLYQFDRLKYKKKSWMFKIHAKDLGVLCALLFHSVIC